MMRLAFFCRILPILFDGAAAVVPPVVPPVTPPAVAITGIFATDGSYRAKTHSRYFRPDVAYRYRRGRR